MNIERTTRVPKRAVSSEKLGYLCHNVADKISANTWRFSRTSNVQLTRVITERMGEWTPFADREIDVTFMDTQFDFYAKKLPFETESGKTAYETTFNIVSTVTQSVQDDEIPPYVLDKIFDEHGERDDGHHNEGEVIDSEILDETSRDDLNQLEILRQQRVDYTVSEDGIIKGYSLDFMYLFDDQEVYRVHYTTDDEGVVENDQESVRYKEVEEVLESHAANLTVLTEKDIEIAIMMMKDQWDSEWGSLLTRQDIDNITEFGAKTDKEHIRRVMAIISLGVSDLFKPSYAKKI